MKAKTAAMPSEAQIAHIKSHRNLRESRTRSYAYFWTEQTTCVVFAFEISLCPPPPPPPFREVQLESSRFSRALSHWPLAWCPVPLWYGVWHPRRLAMATQVLALCRQRAFSTCQRSDGA